MAQDQRKGGLDIYIVIDNDSSFVQSYQSSINWICNNLIKNQIVDGDRLSLFLTGSNSFLFESELIDANTDREGICSKIKQIELKPKAGAISTALSQVHAASRKNGAMPAGSYILVVSPYMQRSFDSGLAKALIYSRVEDYTGWKLITVASESIVRSIVNIAQSFN